MDGSSVALGRTPETWLAESDKHAAKGQHKQFALQVAAALGMSEPQVTRARRGDWMTPTTRDWKDGACADSNVPTNGLLGRQAVRAWVTPTDAARTWPTATTGDASGSGSAGYSTASGRSEGTTLTDAAVRGIWAGTTGSSKSIKGAKLNPAWVEQLMGFPPGWTLLDPAKPKPNGKRPALSRKRRTEPTASAGSATPSSRKSRSSSGEG